MSIDSVTRYTGLATGLDIEGIVGKLMDAHKMPLTKLMQQRQVLNWRQDAYRDINTSVTKLRDAAFNMTLQASYKVFEATSSRTDIFTVTPTADAAAGNYAVKVTQLAKAASRTSAAAMTPALESTSDIDFSTPPLDLKGKDFKVTFGGVTKTISWGAVDPAGEFADIAALEAGIRAKIYDAFGSNQITVSSNGNKLAFQAANSNFLQNIIISDGTASALPQLNFTSGAQSLLNLNTKLEDLQLSTGPLTFDGDGKLQFTINGEDFPIDKTATLQDLINSVNNNANANVKLEYVTSQDKFVLTRKDTGAGKDIVISDNGGTDFLAKINLGAQVEGINAKFDYKKNGVLVADLENPSNNFTLEGITYSFVSADPATEVTFNVTKNVDTVFENIKTFVNQYNETLELLNTKNSEKRNRDYLPLSDDQKKDMSEKDIELWESKAKSGLLTGDKTLSSIINNLRSMWVTPVTGANSDFDQLTELGIKTGSYADKGKLIIDEAKLKSVLSSNLDEVTSFFNQSATPLKGTTLNGNIDVTGKDFKLKWSGIDTTVSLTGSYDLDTDSGKQALVNELQAKINTAIGSGNVTAALNTQNQLEFTTTKALSFEISSGTLDALSLLGLTSGAKYDFYQRGVAGRLHRQTTTNVTSIIEKAGLTSVTAKNSPLSKEMTSVEKDILKMNKKLVDYEDRYYRQFTAMETAINKMNQQSTYFLSQFSGNQG